MAIIALGATQCSLCGQILEEGQNIVGWPHFLTEEHPLWKYSDSGMHTACFEAWEHGPFFEQLCNYDPSFKELTPDFFDFVEEHGLPKWLLEKLDFRWRNPLPADWKMRGD